MSVCYFCEDNMETSISIGDLLIPTCQACFLEMALKATIMIPPDLHIQAIQRGKLARKAMIVLGDGTGCLDTRKLNAKNAAAKRASDKNEHHSANQDHTLN